MNLKLMEIVSDIDHMGEESLSKGIVSNYVQDWLYILHDKDTYTEEDEKRNNEHKKGTLKKAHYHIYLRLKDSTNIKYIASAFNVPENFVSRVKGKWVDVLLYATHRNAPEKHQYSDEEVVSNFDFTTVRDKEEKKKSDNKYLDTIIDKIDSGEIREYNLTKYISMKDYIKFERQIKRAFEYRTQKMKGIDRDMKCIYIQGVSGAGKTTYAKRIAEDKNMSYYISSGSNDVLDDYKGEDCIILDDLRPSCMGLSDLLKMLDNNTSSSVKSRFKNKVLECRLIIITTTLPIETFFRNVFSEEVESAIQLYRRCSVLIKMDLKSMDLYSFNNTTRVYDYLYTVPNPVEFVREEKTKEEMEAFVSDLLGGTIKGLQKIKDGIDNKNIELEPIPENIDPFKLRGDEPKQASLFDYMK